MKTIEVQIAPYGEYEAHDGNKAHEGVVQVIDEEAVDAMVAAFDGEVLVDIDHSSEHKDSTEAAAWVTALRKDPKLGLMGTLRLTGLGEDKIKDLRYKYISPVWFTDKNNRPLKLLSVGLTNTPNLPVTPISNSRRDQTPFKNHFILLKNARSDFGAQGDTESADASKGRFSHDSEGCEKPPANTRINDENERKPEMEKLKQILGLPPESTEEDIAGAVAALKEEIDSFKAAKADAEAEDFANSCDQCEDKEALKNAYKANPELTRSIIANMRKPSQAPEQKKPICNSAMARTPVLKAGKAQAGLDACKNAQERCDYVMRHSAELAAGI